MKCTATSSRTGKPCTKSAIAGATVCRSHGGAAPQVKSAAQRRLDHAEASEAVKDLGLTTLEEYEDLDPLEVLAQELWRSHATERLLRALVDDLHLGDGGIYVGLSTVTNTGEAVRNGDAKPHVLWTMWEATRKHLADVAFRAHRAGLEVRRQELAESTARQVADLLRAVFADPALDLTAAQQQEGIRTAARHLRLVS